MEPIDEYSQFIKNNNFQGLVEYTTEILNTKKDDKTALEYKAKALVSLGLYNESYKILSSLVLRNNNPPLFELLKICKTIIEFDKSYQTYKSIEYPSDWLAKRLLQQIEKTEQEFLNSNSSYKREDLNLTLSMYGRPIQSKAFVELHNYLEDQFHEVYIVGPEKLVNEFRAFDGRMESFSYIIQNAYPFYQANRYGYIYTRDQNYLLPFCYPNKEGFSDSDAELNESCINSGPLFNAPFPLIDWYLDISKITMKHPSADVYFSNILVNPFVHRMVMTNLDKLARENKDYFVPMYHNLIDPNLTAVEQDEVFKWTATDFIIEEDNRSRFNTMISLQQCLQRLGLKLPKYVLDKTKTFLFNKKIPKAYIASPISNIPYETNKELYVVVQEIFNTALPILSKITRPALCLPGKLQVVVKAQRIYLKPGEEYEGVWHRDGKHENIVAVAIYYYRVSKQLIGGDLEFMDKQPIRNSLYLESDDDHYTTKDAKDDVGQVPYCKVPVETGTLVVFSNYQMIHRVLKMTCNGVDTNSPDGNASRDFLLFFIVDESKPLVSTKSDLTIKEDRLKVRMNMFKEQLKPSGLFVSDTELVCTTGNGTYTQIGWLSEAEEFDWDKEELQTGGDLNGFKAVKMLNDSVPLNRGISWVFEQQNC
jgi:hypothetical protein